jgi:hypothetical protein
MDDKVESAPKPRKLLDQVRDAIRLKHDSLRTEQTYVWVKRYNSPHRKQHPKDMGAPQIKAFLEHLAIDRRVSASTFVARLPSRDRAVTGETMNLKPEPGSSTHLRRPRQRPPLTTGQLSLTQSAASGVTGFPVKFHRDPRVV